MQRRKRGGTTLQLINLHLFVRSRVKVDNVGADNITTFSTGRFIDLWFEPTSKFHVKIWVLLVTTLSMQHR